MRGREIRLAAVLVLLAVGLGSGGLAQVPEEAGTNQGTGIVVFESEESARGPEQIAADRRLVERLQARLEADRWVRSYEIEPAARNGVVTLSGTVDNLLSRERAVQLARTVGGVRGIENRILVSLPALPDAVLASEVAALVHYNPVLDSCGMKVEAEDGFIILSGVVDSAYRKEFAGNLARSVVGVRGVENQLLVRYDPRRADRAIQLDVSSRLQWDARLENPQVMVQVVNGRVVLKGWVKDARARERIAKVAWVAGVKGVDARGVKAEAGK